MSEVMERLTKNDREGKRAMHQRLEKMKRVPGRPVTFLLDEEEMERMRRRHTSGPVEKAEEGR